MRKKKKVLKKLEAKILLLFQNSSHLEYNYKQLASILKVRDTKGRNDIIRVLDILLKKEKLISEQRGKYRFNRTKVNKEEAQLRIIPSGKGVVFLASRREDIIIPRKFINKALDGDLVEISVHNKKKNVEAHVESIILRADKEYVGILEKKNDFAFVNCKNSTTYTDFFIEKKELKDYNNGEKVVVKLKSWDDNKDSPDGKIIKSLGLKRYFKVK